MCFRVINTLTKNKAPESGGGQDHDKENHKDNLQNERLDLDLQREHDEQLGMAGRAQGTEGQDQQETDAAAP